MPNSHPNIKGELAESIRLAAEKICAGRPGFDCQEELTPAKVRVALAELSPAMLPAFDAAPRNEVKEFVRQNVWWR